MKNVLWYLARAALIGLVVAILLFIFYPRIVAPPPEQELFAEPPLPASVPVTTAPASSVPLASGPYSYAAAVERAAPAVVNINTAKLVQVRPHPFFNDPIFREFFGRRDDLIRPQQRVETSLGSGVIVNSQGYILTNHHVIQGADAIQVSLRDGRSARARLVGIDPETDIAVLKIELASAPAIALGNAETLRVGDVVLAIGNPFGVGQTVTMGIVSATGRNKLGINTFENFIQTDAAINPGNSGGALVNARGELVGINTAIFSRSGGSQGIGFAIPATLATSVLDDIVRHGRPRRGWLGVEANALSVDQAKALNLPLGQGVIVVGVLRGAPAHQAGLRPGDVILAVDDKPIREARDALLAISAHRPGDRVILHVLREGKRIEVAAEATERPAQLAQTR